MEISAQDFVGKVSLVVIPPESFSLFSLQIVIKMVKELDMEGVYVSANKPYSTVEEELKNSSVHDKILFVDLASGLCGERPTGDKICLIGNPADLTNLNIILSDAIKQLSKSTHAKRGFFVFDSLPTLHIYAQDEKVTRYAHTLGVKLKVGRITGLLLAVEQEATLECLRFLSTVVDKTFHLTIDEEGIIRRVK